ncbi:MAG: hypothetical protein CMK59_14035 [Proteobacteria bacterium]|nr:hypothetical protein [Pseudomonadota bacterium]
MIFWSSAALALEMSPCSIESVSHETQCTVLEVDLSKAKAKLELPVVRLLSVQNTSEVPLYFLAGGPGQASTDVVKMVALMHQDLLQRREVLFLDQRGTGETGLHCEEQKSSNDEQSLFFRQDEEEFLKTCLAELSFFPEDYSTKEAVADLERLRQSLGHERIALYGISYGTLVAQLYAEQYPDFVEAIILDGVVDPAFPVAWSAEEDANRALELMLKDCEADLYCRELQPRLALEQILGESPMEISFYHPRTHQFQTAELGKDQFLMSLRMLLYSSELLPMLPLALSQASQNDWGHFAALVSLYEDQMGIAQGLHSTIFCSESAPFLDAQKQDADGLYTGLLLADFEQICSGWPTYTAKAPAPISSTVPALLLSGNLDPVTPPTRAEGVAKRFENSVHLIAPGLAHGVGLNPCGASLIDAFISEKNVEAENCLIETNREPFFISPAGPKVSP